MFLNYLDETETQLRLFVERQLGVKLSKLIVETPPRIEFGDLAFPFPFELAKTLHRSPQQIAKDLVEVIDVPPHVEKFVAAGGYVNVFFKRSYFFHKLYDWLLQPLPEASGEKVIVEHTNINPNKAAHIGHLRNAVLGDTFVRLLRAAGNKVEVQNYIDNTGVQVADVVVGFGQLRAMSLDDIKSLDGRFDYYCWDLYAEVSQWYREDESRLRYREKVLKEIEEDQDPSAQVAEYISNKIALAHLRTMLRVSVRYQVLPRESEILHLQFWDDAFNQLRERSAITYRQDGPLEGCWTMRLKGNNDEAEDEKIIVRSNGTVTYVGKDIAYQLWKFGLLGKTFHYQPRWRYQDSQVVSHRGCVADQDTVWLTAVHPSEDDQPSFGSGNRVYNVIDVRQSYLQRVVVEGLRRLGFSEQADQSVHFSYEMVALSPKCSAELGIELSEEEKKKPFVEVSGRKGLGVKADDLIDKLIEKSFSEVNARQSDLPSEQKEEISHQIAVGALRYFLLKYARTSIIAFDFDDALSFEGETGPYLQYAVVRANNIFRKMDASDPEWTASTWPSQRERIWAEPHLIQDLMEDNEVWKLLLHGARLEDGIRQSVRTLELSNFAKYAFNLAQQFNLFYHSHHILSEQDPLKKCFYFTVVDVARKGLLTSLGLLGIQVPERM